jgi:hypothetical protein
MNYLAQLKNLELKIYNIEKDVKKDVSHKELEDFYQKMLELHAKIVDVEILYDDAYKKYIELCKKYKDRRYLNMNV